MPAHDEADGLPRALASVAAQTRPVDAVVVTALLAGLFAVPAVALPLAWTILAVYVLVGSAATLFRLVPLPMS